MTMNPEVVIGDLGEDGSAPAPPVPHLPKVPDGVKIAKKGLKDARQAYSFPFGGTPGNWDTVIIGYDTSFQLLSHPSYGIPLSDMTEPEEPVFAVFPVPGKGLGMHGMRDISPGERIIQHIKEHLDWMRPDKRAAFQSSHKCAERRTRFPMALNITLTNGIAFDMPSDRAWQVAVHEHLSRINHCCPPNTLYSFDRAMFCSEVICIRSILANEEITISPQSLTAIPCLTLRTEGPSYRQSTSLPAGLQHAT